MEAEQQDTAPSENYATGGLALYDQAASLQKLHIAYEFHQQPQSAERITDVLSALWLLSFSFAVTATALLASVASDESTTPKQRFLLAVAIVIVASSTMWMILFPAVGLGPSDSPSFGSKIHKAQFIIPASLLHDIFLGMLAFGAATAAAPEGGEGGDVYSRLAAGVAMMFLTAFSLSASLIYLGYKTVTMKLLDETFENHGGGGHP
ncbi:hypothetical protein DUNSADRAFT_16191 [Dunaliella salina]|uniref:Uncharacterized protein n=1 Tax=Dunaliella salina TaxID=3046 RepID=A0ABQ7G419_DUNSA|nr:hypothetical protein DUNSADRAFT_16191 [Dunaliella salina]|eukprot:KAF5829357.1 hypothetical protein DUNSADRAFT_16191 [Dunaliella salina]